jgi:hypothetical protein
LQFPKRLFKKKGQAGFWVKIPSKPESGFSRKKVKVKSKKKT